MATRGQPPFVEGATSTPDLAARAAQMWLSNPLNKFSLPSVNKTVDADGDGLLDKDEFAGLFDLDGDGVIDAKEAAKARALFAMVDKDGDGQLTEEELKQVRASKLKWMVLQRMVPVLLIICCSRLVSFLLLQLAHANPAKDKAKNN